MQLPSLKETIKKYGLVPKKAFGQNFLLDEELLAEIVSFAGDLDRYPIIEIGPGPGGLTRAILARTTQQVYVVEKDNRCVEALRELQSFYPNLHIIEADALHIKITDIVGCNEGKCRIVANLPYNIATKLLVNWLEERDRIAQMTLMFQREVALRLCASVSTNSYGRLSVIVQLLSDVKLEMDISPAAFYPPPKVTSSVVNIFPFAKPRYEVDLGKLSTVTREVFSKRRKMVKAGLKSLTPDPSYMLAKAGIDEKLRPENLTIQDFCRLAGFL